MMHRCSGSQGNMMGPCSCGVFHSQTNSFSMLFSMPPPSNHHHKPNYDEAHDHMYSFASPSSVDCTLSLGTPSTRLTNNDYSDKSRRSNSNCMSNFCWDILHPKHSSSSSSNQSTLKFIRGAASNSSSSGAENLLARRCANCDTTSTPLWRNGPKGPKSLCNACGIRFKKEERRATAAAATNGGSSGGGSGAGVDAQHMLNSSWVHQNSQTQKYPYISSAYANEFRFVEDDDHRDTDTAIPFLSWRLNVTDRPGLVHEFTR